MDTYPKTKYHIKGGGSILVNSAAQEKALGEEWVEIPPFREESKVRVEDITKLQKIAYKAKSA